MGECGKGIHMPLSDTSTAPRFQTQASPHRWATMAEACDYARCGDRTLRRWISEGKITGFRLGRHLRIDLDELDAAMRPLRTAGRF